MIVGVPYHSFYSLLSTSSQIVYLYWDELQRDVYQVEFLCRFLLDSYVEIIAFVHTINPANFWGSWCLVLLDTFVRLIFGLLLCLTLEDPIKLPTLIWTLWWHSSDLIWCHIKFSSIPGDIAWFKSTTWLEKTSTGSLPCSMTNKHSPTKPCKWSIDKSLIASPNWSKIIAKSNITSGKSLLVGILHWHCFGISYILGSFTSYCLRKQWFSILWLWPLCPQLPLPPPLLQLAKRQLFTVGVPANSLSRPSTNKSNFWWAAEKGEHTINKVTLHIGTPLFLFLQMMTTMLLDIEHIPQKYWSA